MSTAIPPPPDWRPPEPRLKGSSKVALVVLALLTAFALGAATMEAFGPKPKPVQIDCDGEVIV
jgi:hypothetical protein